MKKKTSYGKGLFLEAIPARKMGFYEKYIKRGIDIICALAALLVFGWLYAVVAVLVRINLGSPVIFTQERPGLIDPKTRKETIFKMYKFRSMTDAKDENGNLLPDDVRLTKFGAWLRSSSLDELPEVFNILNGTMSIIGPRPQLVRDMVFMTPEQRRRHTAKPGLSGLAQVNGRNGISWEDKFKWDLKYIESVSFMGDIRIILTSINTAFVKQEGITMENMATSADYGDYLLSEGKVTQEQYDKKQRIAQNILNREKRAKGILGLVSIIMPSYNTADYIAQAVQSVLEQTYTKWELIIVDDCSTDNTDQILSRFKDKRIRVIKNTKNVGAAISRNKAIRAARGQWIAFLDSDDLWKKEKLEKQIAFMEQNGYHFSYTNYEEIDDFGNKTNVRITGPEKITRTGMYNYCWPGCLTVMYDADCVGLVQIENIRKNNDYAMWLQISKKECCYLLDEYLAEYRRGRKGSVSTHNYMELVKWHYRLYRKAEKQNVFFSVINTVRNIVFGIYKKKRYVR